MGLYPIGTEVKHCGHGFGKIVGYNDNVAGDPKDVLDKLDDFKQDNELNAHQEAFLNQAAQTKMLNGLYDGDRYPYKIQFEPSEKFPEGYKDVYGLESVFDVLTDDGWMHVEIDGSLTPLTY